MLLRELPLAVDWIGADPEAGGADGGELRLEVAEVAALLRAPRRHGPGIEEEHDRASGQLLRQADGAAVVGRQLEVGEGVTGAHALSKHPDAEKPPKTLPGSGGGRPVRGGQSGESGAPSDVF